MNSLEGLSPELRFVAGAARFIQYNKEVVRRSYYSTLQGLRTSEEVGKMGED